MGPSCFYDSSILPSYHSAGITATMLFIVLRIIQGATIGDEIPIVVIFIKESLLKHDGLACGIIFCFINFGIFFVQITEIVTTYFLSDDYVWWYLSPLLVIFLEKKFMKLDILKRKNSL